MSKPSSRPEVSDVEYFIILHSDIEDYSFFLMEVSRLYTRAILKEIQTKMNSERDK